MKKYFVKLSFLFFLCINALSPAVSAQSLHSDSLSIGQLPSIPFLPDPLILDEGGKNIPVTTIAQWEQNAGG